MTSQVVRTILLLGILVLAISAFAAPAYQASGNGVVITIHTDDCAFKHVVTNLPRRATWKEGVNHFEGCATARPDLGLVILWFNDLTIGLVPMSAFQKVTGA